MRLNCFFNTAAAVTFLLTSVSAGVARAEVPTSNAESPQVDLSPASLAAAPAPPRTERNSIPMMITGIGLSVIGLATAVGGVAGLVVGARDCDSEATSAANTVTNLSLADQAAVHSAARAHCRDTSDTMAVGLGAVIGGSILSAAGIAFTIAGAWKVNVKEPTRPQITTLRVTPSFVSLAGTF